MQQREPIFNVPASVAGVLALLVAVHLALALIPEQDATWWTLALAFIPARLAGHAAELPGGPMASLTSFMTHMLVHGDVAHLGLNCAWLLAFGGAVAQRAGGVRFILFAAVCGLAGAAAFMALNVGLMAPMVGASGAISGLMGAVFRFLFNAQSPAGLWSLRHAPRAIPLMPLRQALTDRRVLSAIGVWIGVNLLALVGIGSVGATGGIAWEAHIGGFLAGLLTYGAFDGAADVGGEDAAAGRR